MISIAIPTKNSSHFILQTLSELEEFSQEFDKVIEIVLVDDASTDDTLEKLTRFKSKLTCDQFQVRVFQNFVSLGQQRNSLVALKQTKGQVIFLMEDDMVNVKNTLTTFLNHPKEYQIDVLIGLSKKKYDRRASSYFFWIILKFFSKNRIPKREILMRQFTRAALDSLLASARPDWTVTENCTLLLQNRSYLDYFEFSYLKSTSRHSFLNRVHLGIGILLRFIQPRPLTMFLLSFCSGSTAMLATFFGLIKPGNSPDFYVILFGLASVFCFSMLILFMYGILMSINNQSLGLPAPRAVASYPAAAMILPLSSDRLR